MNTKEILYNTIHNSQYIIKERLRKFITDNDLWVNGESDPYEVIEHQINQNFGIVSKKLHEYEYEKSYKYFTLYNVNCENWDEKLSMVSEYIDGEEAYIEFEEELDHENLTPVIKEYDSLNEFDIKFSLIKQDRFSGEYIKYPVIATIFKDINLISIKFCSVSERYIEEGFYIGINNLIINWVSENLGLELIEFNSIPVFTDLDEEINRDEYKYPNISIYRVSRQDENDGRSSFSSTRNDRLPLVDDMRKIAQTFENQNDKNRIINFINKYQEESTIRNITLKWKHKFKNSNGKLGYIAVGINMINSSGDFDYDVKLHHIYQQFGINRERVNHVIKFISEYSRRD